MEVSCYSKNVNGNETISSFFKSSSIEDNPDRMDAIVRNILAYKRGEIQELEVFIGGKQLDVEQLIKSLK